MNEENLNMDTDEPNISNDSDSSNSSNENDDGQEEVLLSRAKELENILSDNKYLYDFHTELINIYKQLGDLTSFREAFQRFHVYFPLTPALWLDWINTEKVLATTDNQKDFIFQLFEKAVVDYLSVQLWSEYAQYAIGASNLEKTRIILERAANAVGLVCNGGSLLWATYREIENLHISLHAEGSEEWKKQILKVADIFKRELSVPLMEMENTYMEWKEWLATLPEGLVDPKPIDYGFNKAKKALETYKPFEEQILVSQSNEELINIYKNYVKAVKDPSTVICIYERAAVQLCLVPEFWIEYCSYIFKLGDQALSVSSKALRNCPWSEDLWVMKIRILEHLEKKEDTVMECFEEGISAISPLPGLDLWLAYLEYTHRCVGSPEKLDKLFNTAIQQLGFENDPQCKISRLFCRILAHRGDMKEARKIYGHILSKSTNKGLASMWLEYANIERQYGEQHNLRVVFQRALNAVQDWPQSIIDEWVNYERHMGTLEDVMKCLEKCRQVNGTFKQNYLVEEAKSQQNQEPSTSKVKQHSEGKKRKMDSLESNSKFKRLKEEHPKKETKKPEIQNKIPVDRNPKTTVFVSNLLPSVTEKKLETIFPNAVNLEIAIGSRGQSRCFGFVQFKTEEEVMVALARDREPLDGRPVFISEIKTNPTEKKPIFKYATNEEKNKLFVRGLPIVKTKEEIVEIFKKYGAKDVRLVLHKSGQPKGLAYVEFESEKQAIEAMNKTDQTSIDDHVITVAISAPPPKKDKQDFFGRTFNKRDSDEPTRHPKNRLQTSLLPRSLQVKGGNEKNDAKNGEAGTKMKNNSDFRAMLLKK
ncbi:unnamed protein product [Ceutorhynchus assimilis]|uniref:RRM domain-containing protein n=1 Tax=Ceutorhynchus assimilis TaxID=467358 RepID=A0A9P0DUQ5_9CUCU|nr:unnamed protein product [Ceutorhynchus assimilis]